MSPIIRVGGKNKPAAKKSAAKPAAKRSTAKTTTKRTAATRKPAAAKPKPKATAKKATPVKRGPRTPKTDPKILARHLKALESAGDKRKRSEEMHNEAVNAVHAAASAAIEDEVPMSLISETLGVSRQWLYKMGSFRGRTNGNKPKAKATTAAKRTAAKKPAAKAAGRKPAAKKPAAKTAAKRGGVRVRSRG